jgi:hypothetical protein
MTFVKNIKTLAAWLFYRIDVALYRLPSTVSTAFHAELSKNSNHRPSYSERIPRLPSANVSRLPTQTMCYMAGSSSDPIQVTVALVEAAMSFECIFSSKITPDSPADADLSTRQGHRKDHKSVNTGAWTLLVCHTMRWPLLLSSYIMVYLCDTIHRLRTWHHIPNCHWLCRPYRSQLMSSKLYTEACSISIRISAAERPYWRMQSEIPDCSLSIHYRDSWSRYAIQHCDPTFTDKPL